MFNKKGIYLEKLASLCEKKRALDIISVCNCKLKVTSFSSYFLNLYQSNLSANWVESKGQFWSPSFEFRLWNKKVCTKELVSLKDAVSFHFGFQSEKTYSMEE